MFQLKPTERPIDCWQGKTAQVSLHFIVPFSIFRPQPVVPDEKALIPDTVRPLRICLQVRRRHRGYIGACYRATVDLAPLFNGRLVIPMGRRLTVLNGLITGRCAQSVHFQKGV